jgi:hypothetical protein
MKTTGKAISVALITSVLAGVGVSANTDVRPEVFLLFHELELVSYKPDAPSTFKLFYSPGLPCGGRVSATVARWDYVQKFSEQTCKLEAPDPGNRGFSGYTATFYELIPDDDTTQLWITLQCDTFIHTFKHFFVTTGDTVEHRRGDPRTLPPPKAPPETDEIMRDTLTSEQLQTEYEVILWLRDSTERRVVEQIVGPLPDSARAPGRPGLYRLWISLGKLIEIGEYNIEGDFVTPPPWDHRHRIPNDSVRQSTPKDSAKPQGVLDELHEGAYQLGWILLDHVDGLTAMGELARNQPITFYLVVVNWWYPVDGLSNGFRVYSPDGAQWDTTLADTLPLGWEEMFDTTFGIYSYSANGMGADTVAYFAIASYCGKTRDRQVSTPA